MTDKEIFIKVQEKAISNGWKSPFPINYEYKVEQINSCFDTTKFLQENNPLQRAIIFSHNFAKAFWGESENEISSGYENWEYHLQLIVLEKEPLKYLEKFL